MPHNIEKSGFRKGEYVGYGSDKVWRIRKTSSGWIAHAQNGVGYQSAPTLTRLAQAISFSSDHAH